MPFDAANFIPPKSELYEADFTHLLSGATWASYLQQLYNQADAFVTLEASALSGTARETAVTAYTQYLAFAQLCKRPKQNLTAVRFGNASVQGSGGGVNACHSASTWAKISATQMGIDLSKILGDASQIVWGY